MIIVRAESMKKGLGFCFIYNIYFKHLGVSGVGGGSACLFEEVRELMIHYIFITGNVKGGFILWEAM